MNHLEDLDPTSGESEQIYNILFVDSNWEDFLYLNEIIEENRINLIWARSADEAYAALDSVEVHVLISSFDMRDEDDNRLCYVLKQHPLWNQIFTFVLADREHLPKLSQVMRKGADDVMLKPLDKEIFLTRIDVALRWRQIQAQHQELIHEKGILQTITTVAHEINNPLFAVLGNLEFLEEELAELLASGENPFLRECLDTINEHGQRIADVVRRLQNMTKPVLKQYVGTQQMLDITTPKEERERRAMQERRARSEREPDEMTGEEETFR
jgi:response regulator RpfG family c-di-GMP phosphodiesterase